MIKAIGFVLGGTAVFVGLLLVLGEAGSLTRGPTSAAAPDGQQLQPLPLPAADSAAHELPQGEVATPPLRAGHDAPPPSGPSSDAADADPAPATGGPAEEIDEAALVESMFATAAPATASAVEQPPVSAMPGPLAPEVPPTDDAQAAIDADAGRQWFAVWDPFQSELSAEAFAARLARLTGLDYRVVRTAPARYEVAVGFSDEQERVAAVATIEEATGLAIPGGSL